MPSRCHRPRSVLSAAVLVSLRTLRVSLVQAVDVQLAWDPSSSPQVTGYLLYYGAASGNYSVSVDTGTATTAALSGMVAGQTYYFAATAYDAYGDQSPFSNEVRYAVPVGDTTPPTVTITAPLNGASVPRNSTVTISVTATDNVGVTTVAVYVNGQLTCTRTTAPYACTWKVPSAAGRTYQLLSAASHRGGCAGQCGLIEPHHGDGAVGCGRQSSTRPSWRIFSLPTQRGNHGERQRGTRRDDDHPHMALQAGRSAKGHLRSSCVCPLGGPMRGARRTHA